MDKVTKVERALKTYTTGQVAHLCNVAPRTVSKWFDSGILPGYRIPGSEDRRIPHDGLVAFASRYGIVLPPHLQARGVALVGLPALVAESCQQDLPGAVVLDLFDLAGRFGEFAAVVVSLSVGRPSVDRVLALAAEKHQPRVVVVETEDLTYDGSVKPYAVVPCERCSLQEIREALQDRVAELPTSSRGRYPRVTKPPVVKDEAGGTACGA